MAEPGPSPKKFKSESETAQSLKSHKLLTKLDPHKNAIETALKKLTIYYNFCFVKLSNCNGAYPICFTNAWCVSKRNVNEADRSLTDQVPCGEIFDTEIFQRVLNGPGEGGGEGADSLTQSQYVAMERLSLFLDNIEEVNKILQNTDDMSEVNWAGIVGTHLLKKLSKSPQMIISDSGYSNRQDFCPCRCNARLKYGDTSLGHPDVWHGSVDIILGSNVAVQVLSYVDKDEKDSAVEIKSKSFEDHRDQLIAETIVFSYAQSSGLVPLIAISKEELKIFLYDPHFDLLYESMELDLYSSIVKDDKETKSLQISAVLLLWYALNYDSFCTGAKRSHIEIGYTSGFKAIIQANKEAVKKYENELRFGDCKHGHRSTSRYKCVNFDYVKV